MAALHAGGGWTAAHVWLVPVATQRRVGGTGSGASPAMDAPHRLDGTHANVARDVRQILYTAETEKKR